MVQIFALQVVEHTDHNLYFYHDNLLFDTLFARLLEGVPEGSGEVSRGKDRESHQIRMYYPNGAGEELHFEYRGFKSNRLFPLLFEEGNLLTFPISGAVAHDNFKQRIIDAYVNDATHLRIEDMDTFDELDSDAKQRMFEEVATSVREDISAHLGEPLVTYRRRKR